MRIFSLILLLFSTCCWSQTTTYIYQGDLISGFITLKVPLNFAETTTVDVAIQVQTFVLGASPVLGIVDSATFTTDSEGNITNWSFSGGINDQAVDFSGSEAGETVTHLSMNWVVPPVIETGTAGHWTKVVGAITVPLLGMQQQMTAMQAQVKLWQGASAFYEAHYLAWQAMALKCKATRGAC